jgi:hypothetical protein
MYFTNNTTTNLVSSLISTRNYCEKLIKQINTNLWGTGSLPNKLAMLGLNTAAAYAVGVNPAYLGMVVVFTTFFCLNTTPRWLLEAAIISNLFIITASTLPEANLTQLEYLILFKIIFELLCSLTDKAIQLYSRLTKNCQHSYYFVLILVLTAGKYLVGFGIGFYQGFNGF